MSARLLSRAFLTILFLVFSFPFALHAQINEPIFLDIPPAPDNIESKNPLSFYFSYNYDRCREQYGDNYYKGCQRRLGLEGRRVESGITLNPPLAGEWRWDNDYSLSFTPSEYWQADTHYTVTIDLDALGVASSVVLGPDKVRQSSISFTSKPLTVTYPEMKYMQDPDDPAHKLVSTRLQMNYPVEPKTLESKIRLEMEQEEGGTIAVTGDKLSYEITHEADGMSAWMSVPIKTLPDKDRYLRIIADTGLTAQFGGQPTSAPQSERTRIPTLTSYLSLADAEAAIVRGEDGTPGQALSFSTNVKAKPDEFLKLAKVYLLPAQHPVMKRSKNNKNEIYQWKGENEVTPQILKEAEEIKLSPMKISDEHVTQFGFPFDAPAGRFVYMVMEPGAEAFGGYKLGRKFEKLLKIPEWPNDIEIMQQGSILTLSGSRKLSLHARGTDKLQVEIAHIRTEALQHFISQTSGDISNPAFQNWQFESSDIAQIDTKDLPMNFKTSHDSQYAALDFSSYLKDDKKGLFLLNISGFRDNKTIGVPQQRFVLVTDMGLLVKQGAKNRDVFLVSFASGKPVSGASVAVLGRNGLPVFEGKTDGQGHVELPDFSGYTRDKTPVAITAQKGDDYTFIPFDRAERVINLSQFETGGATTAAEGMNAFVFSDRGIYRPDESAHIGMIVRNADWTLLPEGLPLQFIITDPQGRTVRDEIVKFSGSGLQEFTFDTKENSPTGTYRANLHIPAEGYPGSLLGSASFRVEEFQPDRLRIKTSFSTETKGWLNPEDLKLNVTLTNLYGTPATDRRITASVSLNPSDLSFDAYKDFQFYDSYAAVPRTINYDLSEGKTDAEGKASMSLNLARQEEATYSVNIDTRGYEAGSGRGVTTYATALVSPMVYAVGYKSDANLGYLKKDGSYKANLIAIDRNISPVVAEGLTRDLVRITHVSTLVKRNDGSYAYEATPREEIVKSEPFAIAQSGADLELPSNDIGSFIYRLKDKDLVVAEIPFTIAGEGERTGGIDREAVLTLHIDKESYNPGEKIELNINAPYTGAGLITLESDHVLAYKWFRTDKTDTIQTIDIPKEFSGKGYVSVAFVRDINSREIYMNPLSTSVVPFIANTEARSVKIDLFVPEKVKPGEPVNIAYKGNVKGKAVIYAIDEGILQVARYETPDPIDFFLLDRALQVRTSQMLDLLMPEYDLVRELSAEGGDAAAQSAALGKHLNPFKRKTLAPAIYWSGIVDLDTSERTVTFTPPGHFNGELRVIAVAVADQGVGSTESKTVAQGDLIVSPNAPLFMAPGDETEVSATVANNTETENITFNVTASPGVEIASKPDALAIPQGEEKTISFKIKATDTLESATITIEASNGSQSQKADTTLSIRPASAKETTLTAGYSEEKTKTVPLPRTLYKEFAERQAALSTLPTSYIYGLLRYLDGFPYGCTEQIVSQSFPQLSLYTQPEFGITQDAIKQKVDETISSLRQRQTWDGGFSLWDGGNDAENFISVYTMDFLIKAQEEGLPVPAQMTENGLRFLQNFVNEEVRSDDDARVKSYGIYVLTRSGIVTTNEILHLLKHFDDNKNTSWKTDLTAVYIASAYKMMQQNDLAEQTLKDFEAGLTPDKITYKKSTQDSEWYDSFIKASQYISLAARHFPEHVKTMDKKIVFKLADYIREQYYSTISSSYAIQALRDYSKTMDSDAQPSKIDIDINAKDINLTSETTPFFYTVTETGYDRVLPKDPVVQNMEIERSYQAPDGKPLPDKIAVGDVIEAVITLRSHERNIENVAIVDLLPGGFDLDLESAGKNSTLVPEFTDKREDRIIAFGTATTDARIFRYRLRAVSKGTFIVPPPFAEAMYDVTTKARGRASTITIIDPQ